MTTEHIHNTSLKDKIKRLISYFSILQFPLIEVWRKLQTYQTYNEPLTHIEGLEIRFFLEDGGTEVIRFEKEELNDINYVARLKYKLRTQIQVMNNMREEITLIENII
jgi:hypothetical protein